MAANDIFRAEMAAAGIVTHDRIIADGRLHRINVIGDRRGTRNGWYVLYGNHPVVGIFGCWKRNVKKKWVMEYSRHWPTSALRALREREELLEQQLQANFQDSIRAQKKIAVLWQSAPKSHNCHGYLKRKRVKAFGLRYERGALLVPVMDADGGLHGLQRIWPNGDKRFMPGTILSGNFYLIGEIVDKTILLAEGYSTSATLHQVTGLACAVAFGAENLLLAARALRAAWPSCHIVICGDDDHMTPGNPGRTLAMEAAQDIGADIVMPCFPAGRSLGDTDFNDLYRLGGAEAVLHSMDLKGGIVYV